MNLGNSQQLSDRAWRWASAHAVSVCRLHYFAVPTMLVPPRVPPRTQEQLSSYLLEQMRNIIFSHNSEIPPSPSTTPPVLAHCFDSSLITLGFTEKEGIMDHREIVHICIHRDALSLRNCCSGGQHLQ